MKHEQQQQAYTQRGFNLYHETRAAASIYASLVFVEFAFTLVKALDGQGRPAPCC
jgi:hypothetical protein